MLIKSKHKRTVYGGDIHGEYRQLIFELNRNNITDALVIILGDIGMGFNKHNYYVNEFNRMEKKLKDMNNTIIFFRGNHDDPKYFETDLFDNSYKNIILANDYDIIDQNGVKSLLIGGGISVDRSARHKSHYWDNEYIHYNDYDYDIVKNLRDISILLTHPAPLGAWPTTKPGLLEWSVDDIDLEDDEHESREILREIFDDLKSQGNDITHWYHGHYHENHIEIVDGVEYRCIEMNKLYETI